MLIANRGLNPILPFAAQEGFNSELAAPADSKPGSPSPVIYIRGPSLSLPVGEKIEISCATPFITRFGEAVYGGTYRYPRGVPEKQVLKERRGRSYVTGHTYYIGKTLRCIETQYPVAPAAALDCSS